MGSAAFLIVVSHLVKLLHTAIILFNETKLRKLLIIQELLYIVSYLPS